MANYPELQLYIGGAWKSADGQPVLNPADDSVLGTVPHASRADLDDALDAATKGFKVWSRTSPSKRAEIILKAAQIMRSRIEELAVTMTLEQGKPLAQSRLEILRACEIIEWDAQEGRRVYGRIIPDEPGMRHSVLRQPIGVVAAFSPWNFPTSSPARKVGGALSAGCSIILKASEETPAGAFQLVKAFADAGLPPGVLNLVFGKPAEISEYLIPQPAVRLVTFTGSVPVGKHLTALAGAHMKPVIMELGGHSPVIVCDDVDPAVSGANSAVAKSRNAGQVCVSPTLLRRGRDLRPLHPGHHREGGIAEGRQRSRYRHTDRPARQRAPDRGDGDVRGRCQGEGREGNDRRQPHRQSRQLLSAHGAG